jgi:TRAP-type C4-dicarboxylate transport system permease small subunit
MSLATNLMPFPVRRVVKSFGMMTCLLGSAWFAWGSIVRAIDATAVGEVKPGLLRFPVYPARWAIAFGFVILITEYVARTWEEWHAEPTEAVLAPTTPVDIERSALASNEERVDRIVETLDRLNEEGEGR